MKSFKQFNEAGYTDRFAQQSLKMKLMLTLMLMIQLLCKS